MSSYNAVALKYNPTKSSAPVVVASGSGYMADRIIELAEASGIPIYKDDSTSTILSQLELGSEVPSEIYSLVADIYMYFLKFDVEN